MKRTYSNFEGRVMAGFGPEDWEQYGAVEYLELLKPLYGLLFTSVPNNTWTKSATQRERNSLLGLHPGLGDLFIVCPGKWVLSAEMKRPKTKQARGTVSPVQKEWLAALSSVPNVEALAFHGAEEFYACMQQLLPGAPEPDRTWQMYRPTAPRKRSKPAVDSLPF